MEMEIDMTKQFLLDMEKNFPGHCIYFIDHHHPNKNGNTPCIYIPTGLKWVEKQNNHKVKRDIYFTPNWHFIDAKQKWRRLKEYVKAEYAFVLDEDSWREFWTGFPLEPSIIVKTMHGYHAYWLLKEPMYDIKRWDAIEGAMCDMMGADQKAKDAARVYRLPGSIYWKDNKWKFRTEMVIYNPEIKYTVKEMESVFDWIKKIERIEKRSKKEMANSYDTVEEINRLDVCDVINTLDSRWYVKGMVVYEDWKLTWWYKYYKSKNWLNNFTDGKDYRPIGGPFSIAKQYLWSAVEAFKFFREKYNIWEAFKQEVKKLEKKTITGKNEYTLTTPSGDITFSEESYEWIITVWNEEKLLLDAYIYTKWFYRKDNIKTFLVWYRLKSGESWVLKFRQLGKTWVFETVLSEVWITFFWSKKQKAFLISEISKSNKEYKYFDSLGIYSKELIINKVWQYIIEDKNAFVDIPGDLASDGDSDILKIGGIVTLHDVKDMLEKACSSYKESIMVSLFLSFGLSLFSYYIRKNMRSFPITTLVWLTSAGKTVSRRVMMDMFWIDDTLEVVADVTEFVAMKKAVHYLPLCVWEYGLWEARFDWDPFMKNNFDNTTNMRGTAAQSTIEYKANSPLIIDGENKSTNMAVYTRSIVLFFNPKYMKGLQVWYININKYFIDNYDNIFKLPAMQKKHIKVLTEKYKDLSVWDKSRIISNYSLLFGFADCFWLEDVVKKPLLEQLEGQFNMMWENNVDKTIKNVFMLAVSNWMIATIDPNENTLNVDFIVDTLRNPAQKVKEIQSNIQIVNHHFDSKVNSTDVLKVPLDYIFKTKGLHILANKLFNTIYKRHNEVPKYISESIKVFAENNWYKNTLYYNDIINSSDLFLQNNYAKDAASKD